MKKLLSILLLIFSCEEALETLNPDTTAPTVLIIYPVNESTLTVTTTIKADVTDDSDIAHVKFLIDGTEAYADTTAPYEYEWDVCVLGSGSHSVIVKAEDSAGNQGQSDISTFTLDASYDCEDVCGGYKLLDNCEVCDSDSSNDCEKDCADEWGGDAGLDECGVCGGNGIAAGKCDCDGNVLDECGVCNGDAVEDECGVCDADSSNDCVQDCYGTWGGTAVEDCNGDCNGSASINSCDICTDGNTSYHANYC